MNKNRKPILKPSFNGWRLAVILPSSVIRFSFLFLLTLSLTRSSAQEDSVFTFLSERLRTSSAKMACTQLYLHLDKSVYVHNENIWFAAYVVNSPEDASGHHTLYVQLADKHTKRVVAADRFMLQAGQGAGYLFLPDSLRGGEYNLIAHTNLLPNDPDHHIFQQEIRLRSTSGEPYKLTCAANDCIRKNDSVQVKLKVWNSQRLYAEGAKVNFALLSDGQPVTRGHATVNSYGELFVSAPAAALRKGKIELEAVITEKKKSHTSRTTLPVFSELVNITWYPEGGDLVQGLESRVAFEALYANGKPASFKGALMEDGVKLFSLEANRSGMGFFRFKPKSGKTYTVQPEDPSLSISLYYPPVKEKGTVMQVVKGVANDTLRVGIQTSQYRGSQLYLLGHDYRNEHFFTGIKIQGSTMVKIPVNMLPAGLLTLTLFDSTGQPLAERTVFTGHNRLSKLEITTDSAIYHNRSKVSLKIKARDWQGEPLKASFSLSCILRSRLDSTNFQDIVPFTHLGAYDTHIASRSSLYSMDSEKDLEMYLLTRCWTRYRWTQPKLAQRILPSEPLAMKGQVLMNGGRPRKPVEVVVVNGRRIDTLMTGDKGAFELLPEMLDHNPDENVSLIVNVWDKEHYTVEVEDRALKTQEYLAAQPYAAVSSIDGELAEEERKQLPSSVLSAVTVTARQKEDPYKEPENYVSTGCNDYVCMYNILNCRNHPSGGTRPIPGMIYMGVSGSKYGKIRYKGCEGAAAPDPKIMILRLRGRYYSKEFYVADYSKYNPQLPETLSTIFWSPQIITNDNGEAGISFYTNDLTGSFICIAEGITDNNVISGKKGFEVGR